MHDSACGKDATKTDSEPQREFTGIRENLTLEIVDPNELPVVYLIGVHVAGRVTTTTVDPVQFMLAPVVVVLSAVFKLEQQVDRNVADSQFREQPVGCRCRTLLSLARMAATGVGPE
jgi:hypothetical protein